MVAPADGVVGGVIQESGHACGLKLTKIPPFINKRTKKSRLSIY